MNYKIVTICGRYERKRKNSILNNLPTIIYIIILLYK